MSNKEIYNAKIKIVPDSERPNLNKFVGIIVGILVLVVLLVYIWMSVSLKKYL